MTSTTVKCLSCYGSGRQMGGGMMMQDCEHCEGRGKVVRITEADELELLERARQAVPEVTVEEVKALGFDADDHPIPGVEDSIEILQRKIRKARSDKGVKRLVSEIAI